jgi:hypothetical protein
MLCDPRQDVSEVKLRIQAVELGASDERVDGRGSHPARIGAGEQVIAPAESDGAQGAFRAGVVDLDQPIIDVARKGTPSREGIADGRRGVGLGV